MSTKLSSASQTSARRQRNQTSALPSNEFHSTDFGHSVWPINLAETLPPTAEIDGFDVSKEFFPPEQWLPKNLKLLVQDAFDPFPREMQGQYDVAHLRWFLALPKTKVGPLIRNVMKLLSQHVPDRLLMNHDTQC